MKYKHRRDQGGLLMANYIDMYTRSQKGIKMRMETIIGLYGKGNEIISWHLLCTGSCFALHICFNIPHPIGATSFTMSMWSYYPFVTLPMREWTHYNPWYALKYHCSYRVGELCSHTKKGFSLFPCHKWKKVDIFITRNNFQTLANVVIANPTCIDLVQCASTTTTHAMIVVTLWENG
jgi:hypothetical protein